MSTAAEKVELIKSFGAVAADKETAEFSAATALPDRRPGTAVQRQLQADIAGSPRLQQAATFQRAIDGSPRQQAAPAPLQKKENNTGLPDDLKAGVENLSGHSLDDVQVHYNSAKPAELQAHAYAQGTDIHVAPGQEQHLPHEAWHVVQQMQGRVRPTMQMKGKVSVNDDAGLEKEADVMGMQALQTPTQAAHEASAHGVTENRVASQRKSVGVMPYITVAQRQIEVAHVDFDPVGNEFRDGIIQENNFYTALLQSINSSATINQGHKAIRANVINQVRANNFSEHSIPLLTTAITAVIVAEYTLQGRPLGAHLVRPLVESNLLANIQPDHMTAMDGGETTGFTQLSQAPGVVLSREKRIASTVPYANLPAGIHAEVTARLTEIRNERAQWAVGTIPPAACLPDDVSWATEIRARQAGLHYQGNHTNNAGWLPAVVTPDDEVSTIGQTILGEASNGLWKRMRAPNPLVKLGYEGAGIGKHNPYRNEFDRLRTAELNVLGDAGIKRSAMAALCQGVSAYIEFSMAGGISRLVYEPVNNRVYITAHYKWRDGYNPFFEVVGFPVV